MSDSNVVEMKKKKYLSFDEIIAADDTEYCEVDVWGGTLRFGTLDAGTMLEFVSKNEGPEKKTAGLRLLVDSLVDADGNRIGRKEMVEALKKKNASVINKLCDRILELNGFGSKRFDFHDKLRSAFEEKDSTKRYEAVMAVASDMKRYAAALEAAGSDVDRLKKALEGDLQAEVKND